jgi:general secretion pathway protein G
MKMFQRKTTAAFTLLEIMLVVMIIAMLAGSAIYLMKDNLVITQDVRAANDIQAISTQLMIYENLNGSLPSTAQGLIAPVERPTTEPLPRKWKRLMKDLPVDPWGNVYVLEVPPRRSKDKCDLFSKGPESSAEYRGRSRQLVSLIERVQDFSTV